MHVNILCVKLPACCSNEEIKFGTQIYIGTVKNKTKKSSLI